MCRPRCCSARLRPSAASARSGPQALAQLPLLSRQLPESGTHSSSICSLWSYPSSRRMAFFQFPLESCECQVKSSEKIVISHNRSLPLLGPIRSASVGKSGFALPFRAPVAHLKGFFFFTNALLFMLTQQDLDFGLGLAHGLFYLGVPKGLALQPGQSLFQILKVLVQCGDLTVLLRNLICQIGDLSFILRCSSSSQLISWTACSRFIRSSPSSALIPRSRCEEKHGSFSNIRCSGRKPAQDCGRSTTGTSRAR